MYNPCNILHRGLRKGAILVIWLLDFFFTGPFDLDTMHIRKMFTMYVYKYHSKVTDILHELHLTLEQIENKL